VTINWKLASAFATGAVLASGIVYFAVRPPANMEEPRRVASVKATAPVSPPAPAPTVAAAPVVAPAHVMIPVHVPMPVREKPSPMPPPVRREKAIADVKPFAAPKPVAVANPDAIAKYEPPPAPAAEPQQPPPPARQTRARQTAEVTPPPAPARAVPPVPVENVPVQNVSLPDQNTEARAPHTVTLAAGTLLPVRIGESLSSARNQPGDTFLATLTQPLVIDGFIIAERGARVEGKVVDATQASRVNGSSHLGIAIVRLATADSQNIRIRTAPFVKDSASSAGTDAVKIGAGAAIGAVIGAIAGGGKGAAIGAGAGGVVGAGDVLLTRGKPAEIPVETRVSFRVQDSVSITERLD
jgi:hypothetical protein